MSSTDIVFASFEDALNYRTNCPLCNSKNEFESSSGINYQNLLSTDEGYILKENSIGIGMTVNLSSRKIESLNTIATYGTYFAGLKFKCRGCNNYYFFIKLELDISQKIVKGISISREVVFILNNEKTTKIYISYAFNEIEVFTDISNMTVTKFKLPLIKLDLSSKNKILETIGQYAAFI